MKRIRPSDLPAKGGRTEITDKIRGNNDVLGEPGVGGWRSKFNLKFIKITPLFPALPHWVPLCADSRLDPCNRRTRRTSTDGEHRRNKNPENESRKTLLRLRKIMRFNLRECAKS